MYNKLFTKILDSSIWLEPDATRLIWITLIAAMDEDGFVQLSAIGNLAGRARVSIEDATKAVQCLESTDSSGDQEFEGRRIERVPGGWVILNARKYRDMVTRAVSRESNRVRVARHRAKNKTGNASVMACTPRVMQSEAEAEAESEAEKNKNTTAPAEPTDFATLKAIYPKRAGANPWGRALKACRARLKEGCSWEGILEGARRYQAFCHAIGKEGTEYVLQAATFCGPEKHFNEAWSIPKTKHGSDLASIAARLTPVEDSHADA
jgi:hypothetical protein